MAKAKSMPKAKTARKRTANAPSRRNRRQQPPPARPNQVSLVAPSMRSLRVYDPFSSTGDVPIAKFEGEAKGVNGALRREITVGQNPVLLCIGNTGHNATVVSRVKNSAIPDTGTFNVSYLNSAGPGYPTSGRAMRIGVRLQNTSKVLDMQGRIFVLNTNKRQELPAIPSAMTQAQWDDLIASIQADPRTRTFNGANMQVPVKAYASPHDDVDYHNYGAWTDLENIDSHMSHFTAVAGTAASSMAMSCIWVVFVGLPGSDTNLYNMTVLSSYYTRWASAEVMSSMMKPPPLADLKLVNQQKAVAHVDGQPRPDPGKSIVA